MNHPETAIAGLYDHQQEHALEPERSAPDWGGDELFTTTPRRRRFERDPRTRAGEARAARRPSVEAEAPPRMAVEVVQATRHTLEVVDAELGRRYERGSNGRRTVTVTGHPGGLAPRQARPLYAERHRPGRSLDEHFASRPDRIAMWAFGLGVLLIVISILTANT